MGIARIVEVEPILVMGSQHLDVGHGAAMLVEMLQIDVAD